MAVFTGRDGATGGELKMATGMYVGTGTYGASNPCSLTFDFVPCLVIMGPYNLGIATSSPSIYWFGQLSNAGMAYTPSENQLSWYANDPAQQCNFQGYIYTWFALGQ